MKGIASLLASVLAGLAAAAVQPGREACGWLARAGGTGRRVSGAGRAAAAGAQDELGRQQLDLRAAGRLGDPVEQPGAGPLAEQAHRLVHGGERRVDKAAGEDVVEADHRHVLRHPHAGAWRSACSTPMAIWSLAQTIASGSRLAAAGEQLLARLLAAVRR